MLLCFICRYFCHLNESPGRTFTFKCQFCVVVSSGNSTDKKLRESENPQAQKIIEIFSSFFLPNYMENFMQMNILLPQSSRWCPRVQELREQSFD